MCQPSVAFIFMPSEFQCLIMQYLGEMDNLQSSDKVASASATVRNKMESEKKELDNLVNVVCRKMAHIIVESRLGKKIHTPCKVHADGSDWFNLSTVDMPEVVKEVKRLLAASGGLAEPCSSFCVEISLKTSDGVALVLEQWTLTLDRSAGTGGRPANHLINQLGVLMKSLVVTTRLTSGYKLSRQQGHESHVIFYKIYTGQPELTSLGEAAEQLVIGEVSTPLCSISLSLYYRTKLALSTYSDPIVMKSDHFKPELSPRVRRVTAFVERRHSDSVEMMGVSSSSSSNMDTKTTGGSSTDSDQRRRVAAFAEEPAERPPPVDAAEVPFTRLVGEPSPPAAAAARPVPLTPSGPEPPHQPHTPSAEETAAAATAATDDFVMVELRTPFSESESDSELSSFFRQWQAAAAGPPVGSPTSLERPQPVSLSHLLETLEVKSREYDDMIAQLSRTDLDAK